MTMRTWLLLALGFAAHSGVMESQGARGSGGVNEARHRDKPYVILVSFDGFAAAYVGRYAAPNFDRVAREGVRARSLVPVFPTKTFPNHYSIATGLLPERHGLVANRFYDPVRNASYALGDSASVGDGTWYGGEPIWVTAERQGMVTASYFWVGTEAAIGGVRPTIWKRYNARLPNFARVDSVLAWLSLPAERRPHMITLYMSTVDDSGHAHGPRSPAVGRAIAHVDAALGRLLDGIGHLPVRDSVVVLLVSDHGMAAYSPRTSFWLPSLIDVAGIRVADAGPNANLHVSGGPERAVRVRDSINRRLRHGRAYLRNEVPVRFRYRENPRIGDVVILMDEGYQISSWPILRSGGQHGWDNRLASMQAIFFAWGAGIRKGAVIPAFENTQIYRFMAEVLELEPASGVEGTPGWLRSRLVD